MKFATKQLIKGVVIGALGLLGVGVLVTLIASSVNGVPFGDQIINWIRPENAETTETVVETAAACLKLI